MNPRLFHGGAPGLRVGDRITPRRPDDNSHLVDGCPICEARRNGEQHELDDNDPGLVYVTTDRDYARIYAAGYPRGGLYIVEPEGELVDRTGTHDPAPSWGCPAATVRAVYDPVVTLNPRQTRRLWRRYMGSEIGAAL
jgi:hypothetical protein